MPLNLARRRVPLAPEPIQRAAPNMAQAGNLPPTITPTGESAHSRNLTLSLADRDRGMQEDREAAAINPFAPIHNVARDPRFGALFEALRESNTDRLTTGAARGWEPPGYFDQQETDAPDLDPAQDQRAKLLEALALNQGNYGGAASIRGQVRR